MTDKELHRLKKQDLLQLLLTQGKEAAALQAEITALSNSLADTQAGNARLKAKLNEKDELIEKLKDRLDEKDNLITRQREKMREWRESRMIELEDAGNIAEAALRLNGIFEAAQKAADQYIENLKQRCDAEYAENE